MLLIRLWNLPLGLFLKHRMTFGILKAEQLMLVGVERHRVLCLAVVSARVMVVWRSAWEGDHRSAWVRVYQRYMLLCVVAIYSAKNVVAHLSGRWLLSTVCLGRLLKLWGQNQLLLRKQELHGLLPLVEGWVVCLLGPIVFYFKVNGLPLLLA